MVESGGGGGGGGVDREGVGRSVRGERGGVSQCGDIGRRWGVG